MPAILVTISPESEETCRGCGLLQDATSLIPGARFTCRAGITIELFDPCNGKPVRPQDCLDRVKTTELIKLRFGADYDLLIGEYDDRPTRK